MKTPKITEQVSGYLVEWEAEGISAKIGRAHVHSDGRVTGELQINHRNGTGTLILLPASSFNFSSEQTRSKFAKQLKEKYQALNIEWHEVFDLLGHKIQELARSGDTVQEVWLADDEPAPEKLLAPIIYKGVQNIIFGEKGVNKSTVSYAFAICLSLPWPENPLELDVPENPVKTLVLDWETDESIFRYYLSRMMRGMNIPTCPIFYRRCTLPLAQDVEQIQRYIEQTGADLLLIDSLGAAAGGERGELKGSEAGLIFNSALRRLKKTSLIIAQTSKDTESKRKTIYGSTFFTYYARNIFELCKGQDDAGDEQHLALFHRDCNLGKKSPPLGFKLTFDDLKNTINIKREPVSVTEFAEKVSTASRIVELIKEKPLAQKDMVEALEVSFQNCYSAIKRLQSKRIIVKLPDGRWGLLNNAYH